MTEAIILGIVQGVAEWLPISSEGVIVLLKIHVFNEVSLVDAIRFSLFLHLGTFAAALVYFRKDIRDLLRALFSYHTISDDAIKKELRFYIFATLMTGIVGWFFFSGVIIGLEGFVSSFASVGRLITFVIGALLLITAFFQFAKGKKGGFRRISSLRFTDALTVGFVQGAAVLPGISRSGITVAALLLRDVEDHVALRLSFLMSLPAVLGGNIILNFSHISFTGEVFASFVAAFLSGILTIHFLLGAAKKISFAWFVLLFGILTLVAALVM